MVETNGGINESKIRKVFLNEITIGVFIIGTVFTVVNYFFIPTKDNESAINLINLELKAHEETTKQLTNIKDNDLHTIQLKQIDQEKEIQNLRIAVEKLSTIIEERIPKK